MADYIKMKQLNPGSEKTGEDPKYYYEMIRYDLGMPAIRDGGYWCHLIMLKESQFIALEVVENKQNLPSMIHKSNLTIKTDKGDIILGVPFQVMKEDEYTNAAGNRYYERAVFFELSKTQLKQICDSNSVRLDFLGGGRSKNVGKDFVTWSQYFYHHLVDETAYIGVDNQMNKHSTTSKLGGIIIWLIILTLLIIGVILTMRKDQFLTGFILMIVAIIAALIKSPKLRLLFEAFNK